jgi:DNA primase (bacterial type)
MSNNYRYEYVKSLINSEEYFRRFIKLKKVGMIYQSSCPFHDEKTPSFYVYPAGHIDKEKNAPQEHATFYCFGCGAGGDLFEFKKRWDNLPNRYSALEELEKELGVQIEDDEVITNLLRNQLDKMSFNKEQFLSLSEINIVCSSMCRNYLLWVKDYFPEFYNEEKIFVDKCYLFFDKFFEEKTSKEAFSIIEEVERKISKRKEKIKNVG